VGAESPFKYASNGIEKPAEKFLPGLEIFPMIF
jgi:hypothetical protein